MKTSELLIKCENFYKIATQNFFKIRPSRAAELFYIYKAMEEDGIPAQKIILDAAKLIEKGEPITQEMGFELIKVLKEQQQKGWYEGERHFAYNANHRQTNPESLNRVHWHVLNHLISKIILDLYPED